MFFACSRDSRSTEAYLVAEIITLIYLTVTRTVPAASLKQLLERNFAENYDGWWRGREGEELSNFPLKFDPEKERKKEEEKKMVTLSSLMRPFRTIYIYTYTYRYIRLGNR